MKQECDQLRIKTLDQTNKEIIMAIKRSSDEIIELQVSLKHLKKSHEVLQDDHAEVTKDVQRMKTSLDDTVPWNIRGKHLNKLC